MDKEFCNYTQALALKELGFDEPCTAIYYSKDKSFSWHHHKDHTNNEPTLDSGEFNISAPLYQQAFRFFREKYNRLHTVNIDLSNNLKDKVFIYTIEDHLGSIVDRSEEYKTYEEAESACLNKLIEIVKNK